MQGLTLIPVPPQLLSALLLLPSKTSTLIIPENAPSAAGITQHLSFLRGVGDPRHSTEEPEGGPLSTGLEWSGGEVHGTSAPCWQ